MRRYAYSVLVALAWCVALLPMATHTGVGSASALVVGSLEWYVLFGLIVLGAEAWDRAQGWANRLLLAERASTEVDHE